MPLDFSQSWPYFLVLILLLPIGLAWRSFAPWLPAHARDLKRIIALADLKSGDIFIDLGCGDGRVVQAIAQQTQATAIGVELAWPWIIYCNIKQFFLRIPRLSFIWKDLFQVDLSNADIIYLFGTPKTLQGKLKAKLKRELKPSARVISYCFSVEGWQPSLVDHPSKQLPIFVYELAAQAE